MKKVSVLLLTAALLMGLVLSVSAAEVPDPNRKGTLTLVMEWDGQPLDSGYLTLYRVGEVAETDGNYFFVPVPELDDTGVSLKDLTDKQLPQQLAELAVRKKLEPISVPIRDGEAVVTALQAGLYVVTQGAEDACDGFSPIHPFLISLPYWDGEAYRYDRMAQPKVALQQEVPPAPPETEPPEPSEPDLPQTGQMNWPVPVMAVSGLALILMGWILRHGKKARNED